MIDNVIYKDDNKTLSWTYKQDKVSKKYTSKVSYTLIDSDNFIVIVEPDDKNYPDNAVVYNAQGNFVRRLINPCKDKGAVCFDSVYISGEKIILISVCPRVFYECRLNKKGELIEVRETR